MKNAKILLVDDIAANLISLEYLLHDYFEDIEIILSNNGEDALKISFSQHIDLVILDVQMPEMDGFEVAKFLKSSPKTKNIPIIFITAAFKEEEFQEKGFSIGAVDYLTKPINNTQLINKLRLYMEIFKKNYKLQSLLKENNQQQQILKTVLNTEKNLILVTNFQKISFANRSFLEFFDINIIDEFSLKYKCFLDNLLDEKNAIHNEFKDLNYIEKGRLFFKTVQESNEENKVIYLKDKYKNKNSFFISISKIKDEDELYLLSLTNITNMRKNQLEITKKAFNDELTGVFNRSKFNEVLSQKIEEASKTNEIFSCLILDIDNFKNFNDTYGHLIGDEVLILIAQTISQHIRNNDFFARWGGEEFVLLLSDTSLQTAIKITEKLRNLVENISHEKARHISASFGVTQYMENDDSKSIFERCDKALYMAKESGRNCVVSV